MLTMTKLLVPVDFSAASLHAASQAAELARHYAAELTLLHVNPLHNDRSAYEAPMLKTEWLAKAEEELRGVLGSFATTELAGATVKRAVQSGDPAKIIIDYAHSQKINLIFISTHGHGSLRRFLLGSVTAKVLHDAECPVWTTTHLAEQAGCGPTRVKRVLCAVDFGHQSTKALGWAAQYAKEFGAKLTAVHAVTPTPPQLPDRYMFHWHGEAHCGAEERLRSLLRESQIDGDSLIVDGDAPRALAAAAKQKNADLFVMGRSCVSGRYGRLGSDAYGIICHAPCPVVSI